MVCLDGEPGAEPSAAAGGGACAAARQLHDPKFEPVGKVGLPSGVRADTGARVRE